MSNARVWRAAQDRLRQEMTRAQFDTWLRATELSEADDGTLVVFVRTTFARELLESRFRERIESSIAAVTGVARPVRVQVGLAPSDDAGAEAADERSSAPRRHLRQHGSDRDAYDRPSLFEPQPALADADVTEVADAASHAATYLGADPGEYAAHVERVEHGAASETSGRAILPLRREVEGVRGGAAFTALRTGRGRGMRARMRAVRDQLVTDADADGLSGFEHTRDTQWDRPAALRIPENEGSGAADDEGAPSERRPGDDGMATMAEFDGGREFARDGVPPMADGGNQQGNGRSAPLPFVPRIPPREGDLADASVYAGQLPPPRLNARYTFSTFIVGSGNQLAHAASLAVAEAPGQAYNPLFLYGGVGLGKTHLLHAVGHSALERGLTVLYVSSETFTNEIINAIRYRTTEEFRSKYRSVDILLVDDIQFIAGKESTEEEFFHTFNSLYEASKQIVICSDRPPKAIISLAERLRSRFEWGLIADIQPPDLETRVAILRAKADAVGRRVPDELIAFIATRVQSNIRELEGTLNRLLAYSQLQGLPLTIDTAKSAMANLASDGRQRRVSINDVLEAVAEYYHLGVDDLRGKQRDKHIVMPRQVAMYLMRQETEASLLEIGQALGGRDHSTVLHGYEKIAREINENTPLRKEVTAIRQQLLD